MGTTLVEDPTLREKREELKRQLEAGAYRTLIDLMMDGTGRLVQKLTRSSEPPSFWYSAVVIVLTISLISLLTSILVGVQDSVIKG